jgi:hypothetical protein
LTAVSGKHAAAWHAFAPQAAALPPEPGALRGWKDAVTARRA